jgi:hypothetical protein
MIRIKSRMHDIIKHDAKFGTHLIPQISRSMSFPDPTGIAVTSPKMTPMT